MLRFADMWDSAETLQPARPSPACILSRFSCPTLLLASPSPPPVPSSLLSLSEHPVPPPCPSLSHFHPPSLTRPLPPSEPHHIVSPVHSLPLPGSTPPVSSYQPFPPTPPRPSLTTPPVCSSRLTHLIPRLGSGGASPFPVSVSLLACQWRV
ncbi:hypothetical protein E2C01_054717 [Portunus trituberculatus]|uniref:Uncharacterized protein n=1 Tax=Portunus trituberculatus TaxID=210409 RepID=A0A5B7GKL2_PORTR|nr:hypothetical protein [Portunus trituberculatus]